jgi:hypothetical protein
MPLELDPTTRAFYRRAMTLLREAGIPFLVGGAYAMARYTGIERHTKDFDLFVKPEDAPRVLRRFTEEGYSTELTHPHWLGKVYSDDAYVDVIFRSGNAVAVIDDEWFEHAVKDHVLDMPALLCPAEEIIWSKGFVMERERYDGADMAHLIRSRGADLDWKRLLGRYGENFRVLLSHLVLFGFIYPGERSKVPQWVMDDLIGRLGAEEPSGPPSKLCRGTLLSRSQYLVDLERSGYVDARLEPIGSMSQEDIDHWTAAIELDGSV